MTNYSNAPGVLGRLHGPLVSANAALARIENADIYRLRTYPVIEITLGLGNDCSVRQIGITRSIERRRP